MSVPPCYGDLGKAAKDLFSRGYNYGSYKLDCKTKTESGVEFKSSGSSNHDSGKISGNLETKYQWKDYGMTFTEKWNTDNSLGATLTIKEQLMKGLEVGVDTKFQPQSGKKQGTVKTDYQMENLHVTGDVDFDFAGPTLNASAVLGYNGWLAGYQMTFETAKSALSKNNFAVGYKENDFTLHAAVNDGKEFIGSYHHKIRPDLESGVQLSWASGNNVTQFGLAGKYFPEPGTTFSAKINNSQQLGLAYEQELKKGITFSVSTLIEARNFSQGGHKVGFGLNLSA